MTASCQRQQPLLLNALAPWSLAGMPRRMRSFGGGGFTRGLSRGGGFGAGRFSRDAAFVEGQFVWWDFLEGFYQGY